MDNGTLSVQTRLDRHETVVRSLLWVVSVLATLGLGGLVAGGFAFVKHLL